MKQLPYYLLVILVTWLKLANATMTLSLVTESYNILDDAYKLFIQEFNKYANETDLGIQLEMTYFTDLNNNQGYNDYSSTLSAFAKKRNKYDIFAYDTHYLKIFSPYLVELENYLPQEYLDMYSTEDNKKLSVYNGHRLGMPLYLIVTVMFSNMNYLNKYNKPIPRTWDELIETAEFILKEEKEKYNNTEIIGYNGLFPDNENTMCSLYQLLYSYRDTVDSPLPDFGSKTAIEAVNKIMEIKDRISSDEIFRSAETLIVAKMIAEELLFVNFYSSFNAPNYTTSVLPGKIDGINGSILGGFNIGINKYIDEKRKIACIEVFKFLLSKDFQRDVIVKKLHLTTPLSELYNDPDACTVLNCEMMNEIQFFLRPSTTMKNYEDFSNKGVKLFYQILDGEKSVEEVLNDFDSYIHVYSFVVNSTVGGIMLGIIIFILVIVILSSVLLFIPKFRSYFNFLTTDVWFIYTVGSIFMLASTVEYYNEPTIVKCKTRQIFNLIGNSLVLIPILYRLVINFPKINSYSQWVHRNNYIFISGFLLIQILLSALTSSVESFTIKDVNFDTNSKNFRMCVLNPTFKPISLLQYIYNIMLYIVICFLIFLEWNIQETYFDLRHFSVVMIMNGITQILFIVLNNLDINNYILYSVLFISFTLLFVITNHIYIFVIRLILLYTSENDDEKKMSNLIQNSRYGVSSTKNAFSKSEVDSVKSSTQSKTSKASKNSESSSSYRSKLLNYHYTTSPVA